MVHVLSGTPVRTSNPGTRLRASQPALPWLMVVDSSERASYWYHGSTGMVVYVDVQVPVHVYCQDTMALDRVRWFQLYRTYRVP